jgi:hypothetical protein
MNSERCQLESPPLLRLHFATLQSHTGNAILLATMVSVVCSRRPTNPRADRPTSKMPSAATAVGGGARVGRGGGRADDPPGEDTPGATMPTARSSTRVEMDNDESMRTTFRKVALTARGTPRTTVPPPQGRKVMHRPGGHPWELEGATPDNRNPKA